MVTEVERKFDDLPEGCISEILSLTTPLDASRSAKVSKLFLSASESDSVWERFIPTDLLNMVTTQINNPLPKKRIYFTLCNTPMLIDHGTKSVHLERASGKKCYMVGARDLNMAWADNPMYWEWISDPNSRFDEVAFLRQVFWFDIIGHLETRILTPNTTYAAYLVFKFGERDYGFNQTFKSYVSFVTHKEDGDAEGHTHSRLVDFRAGVHPQPRRGDVWLSKEREDGWLELQMGHFTVPGKNADASLVRMQVREVERQGAKSGIIVQGIEVRPSVP